MTKLYIYDIVLIPNIVLKKQKPKLNQAGGLVKMTSTNEVTVVNATFNHLGNYNNVLVLFPDGKKDKFLKLIPAHSIQVPEEEDPIEIAAHFRRGDIIDGKFVTKHFFINEKLQGSKIIVNVEVIEKTDHAREDSKSIILNITPADVNVQKPCWRLKVGTDKAPETDGYQIPGTEKFIAFEKIG